MKSILIATLGLVSVAMAANTVTPPTIPACAKDCIDNLLKSANCGTNDWGCACNNAAQIFRSGIMPCAQACAGSKNPSDGNDVIQNVNNACSANAGLTNANPSVAVSDTNGAKTTSGSSGSSGSSSATATATATGSASMTSTSASSTASKSSAAKANVMVNGVGMMVAAGIAAVFAA